MLLFFAVLCHGLVSVAISGRISSASPPFRPLTTESLHSIQSWLQYHLYFDTYHSHVLPPSPSPLPTLTHSSNGYDILSLQICDLHENYTETLVSSNLFLCTNPDFFPRILSTSQVSFKKVDVDKQSTESETKPKKIPRNRNESSGSHNQSPDLNISFPSSNLTSNAGNLTKESSKSDLDEEDDDKTIHKYLLFALVIPKHPFSREIIHSLQVISPLYPSVTFYFGISYEFSDLCLQYGVKSFPKVLFFHNGMLVKKYSDARDPVTLGVQIARWIGKFPAAIPLPLSAVTRKRNSLASFYNYNSTWFTVPSTTDPHVNSEYARLLQAIDSALVLLSAGRSVEPLVAYPPEVTQWDFEIFLATIAYSLGRLAWWGRSWWLRRKSPETGQGESVDLDSVIPELERNVGQLAGDEIRM
jgi:hypothetical protein